MSKSEIKSLDEFRAALNNMPNPDETALTAARNRNAVLTKPPGALGRIEELAIWYAGWRGQEQPTLEAPQIIIFAGNHGIAARGVSAFPADVTAQMVANFDAGGAAINQLARTAGARLDVVPLAMDQPTADFTEAPAMDDVAFCEAINAGWCAVDAQADLLVVGEMGIGNTTSAAALCAAVFGGAPAAWTGRGTGVDDAGMARKTAVVAAGLARHSDAIVDPLDAMRCLGGRELAAMAGAILRARHLRIPVILDGFICCAAAGALECAAPGVLDHAVAGHQSSEAGHTRLLSAIDKEPLLSLDLRLGEGSGAALAIPILRGAIACLSGMATFAEAGVTDA